MYFRKVFVKKYFIKNFEINFERIQIYNSKISYEIILIYFERFLIIYSCRKYTYSFSEKGFIKDIFKMNLNKRSLGTLVEEEAFQE